MQQIHFPGTSWFWSAWKVVACTFPLVCSALLRGVQGHPLITLVTAGSEMPDWPERTHIPSPIPVWVGAKSQERLKHRPALHSASCVSNPLLTSFAPGTKFLVFHRSRLDLKGVSPPSFKLYLGSLWSNGKTRELFLTALISYILPVPGCSTRGDAAYKYRKGFTFKDDDLITSAKSYGPVCQRLMGELFCSVESSLPVQPFISLGVWWHTAEAVNV